MVKQCLEANLFKFVFQITSTHKLLEIVLQGATYYQGNHRVYHRPLLDDPLRLPIRILTIGNVL
jgi:hypothetical protein